MQLLKIIDATAQSFSTQLNGKRIAFFFRYNSTSDRWSFDLSIEEVLVLSGRRIIVDTNLLHPFVNYDIGMIFCLDPEGQGNEANRDNLPGGIVRLYNATREEVLAIIG